MSRRLERIATFALLALIAPACLAAEFTFANGNFTLSVPDGWPRIMQSQGDPESMVFQVPDPSSTAKDTLARVSVTSQRVHDIASFERIVAQDMNHARTLENFTANKKRSTPTALFYSAEEGHVSQTYAERYYYRNGFAIQVRCVRPSRSAAGKAWTAAFDRGCTRIATSIK